ncbi:MAG: S41 family peptidase [Bacteroidota bacterium]
MNRISCLSIMLVGLIGVAGCDSLVPDAEQTDPVAVFEDAWAGVDRYAGNLAIRGVDWDSVYTVYQPRFSADMPADDVFDELSDMLYVPRDPHIRLIAPERTFVTTDRLAAEEGWTRGFDRSLVLERLGDTARDEADNRILWGRIGDIGYLWIRDFKGGLGDTWFDEIHRVLDQLADAPALIIDVRDNDGGNGIRSRDVAGRFASEPAVYLRTQQRLGPAPDAFSEPYEHVVRPFGDTPYRRPVVALTSQYTVSAAERFLLALRTATDATLLGDCTSGTPGSTHERELVNGWLYSLSFERVFTVDGQTIDGVGICPDERIAVEPGRDRVLDRALEVLAAVR